MRGFMLDTSYGEASLRPGPALPPLRHGSFTVSDDYLRLLLGQVAYGDHEAFGELFDILSGRIHREVEASGLTRYDAAAVVSMTFVEVWWLARFHLGKGQDIEGWISAIAAYRATELRESIQSLESSITVALTNHLAAVTLATLLDPVTSDDDIASY
jgi:hypothetical protein